jgi:hypothetical protein
LINAASVSRGFTALLHCTAGKGRLDLTVEAVILQEGFASLFSGAER